MIIENLFLSQVNEGTFFLWINKCSQQFYNCRIFVISRHFRHSLCVYLSINLFIRSYQIFKKQLSNEWKAATSWLYSFPNINCHLVNRHLGSCHLGSCPWEKAFGKVLNFIQPLNEIMIILILWLYNIFLLEPESYIINKTSQVLK